MAFAWTEPKLITTKDGRRVYLRSSPMAKGDPFWEHWNDPEKKAYMKGKGISPQKGRNGWSDGQINQWIPHTRELEQVNAATGQTRLAEQLAAQDAEMRTMWDVAAPPRVALRAREPEVPAGINIRYG